MVEIYFDTATFDNIERDKKIKTEAQLSLIGGTMGLLTGFSIISGVEIIFFLIRSLPVCSNHKKTGFVQSTSSDKLLSRLVASFRITQSDVKSAVKAKFENHLM